MKRSGVALAALCCATALAAPITLALAGDLSLARGTVQAQGAAWSRTFALLGPSLRAEVTFANLESPLTDATPQGGGLDLRAPPGAVAALSPFTHLGLENNHAGDGGEGGQRQVRRLLAARRIFVVDRSTRFQTLARRRLAWLAFLDDGGALPLEQIRAARRATGPGGLVIVAPHWGEEYRGVSARQREAARRLASAGADLIVGSGPHVVQESERLGRTLVFYSLGNLLFDQPYPATWPSAVVRVTQAGPGAVLLACAVPTFSRSGRVWPAPAQAAQQVLRRLNLPSCGE